MAYKIFYDFETSDKETVGQIMTYCFKVFNSSNKLVDILDERIKIAKTQLPDPEAIVTSKIDVLKHQEISTDDEFTACKKIYNLLEKYSKNETCVLIGYNSNKFDLNFLRTTLIRNGYTPYFKNLKYKDLLHLAQYLYIYEVETFKNLLKENNLKLSNLSLSFFNYTQLHNAEDDVDLCIKLNDFFYKTYNLSVDNFEPYQASKRDVFFPAVQPNYNGKDIHYNWSTFCLLDDSKSHSLWINLNLLGDKILELENSDNPMAELKEWANTEDSKKIISWSNKKINKLFRYKDFQSKEEKQLHEEYIELGPLATEIFSHVNLTNFFPEKNCDVEQFIYMINFTDLNYLKLAIHDNNPRSLLHYGSDVSKMVFERYLLSNDLEIKKYKSYSELFTEYVDYRYRGKMKLDKFDNTTEYEENIVQPGFHPTFEENLEKIRKMYSSDSTDEQTKQVLKSLESFYLNSDIYKTLQLLVES